MDSLPKSYEMDEKFIQTQKSSTISRILVFYASALTVAMVILIILGSLHIQKQNVKCDEQEDMLRWPMLEKADSSPNKMYHISNDDQSEEEIEVDTTRDREIIRLQDVGANDYSLIVLDFSQNFGAIFDALTNTCYLMGGLDANLPDSEQLQQLLDNKTGSNGIVEELNYSINNDRPIRDVNLLPVELQPVCWGKPVFWLKTSDGSQKSRRKRGCYRRCWNVGRGRVCVWVCAGRG